MPLPLTMGPNPSSLNIGVTPFIIPSASFFLPHHVTILVAPSNPYACAEFTTDQRLAHHRITPTYYSLLQRLPTILLITQALTAFYATLPLAYYYSSHRQSESLYHFPYYLYLITSGSDTHYVSYYHRFPHSTSSHLRRLLLTTTLSVAAAAHYSSSSMRSIYGKPPYAWCLYRFSQLLQVSVPLSALTSYYLLLTSHYLLLSFTTYYSYIVCANIMPVSLQQSFFRVTTLTASHYLSFDP